MAADAKQVQPFSLDEALSTMSSYPELTLVAGGTDVVVNFRDKPEKFKGYLFLNKIKGLDCICFEENELRIGALVTHSQLEREPRILKDYTALAQGSRSVGSLQVRNIATVGGNLCSGLPSADTASPLLVLDASVRLVSLKGERTIPLTDFFVGPGKTLKRNDEILTEIIIPKAARFSASAYQKHGKRKALELAINGAAVCLELDQDEGICSKARIALTTAAPTPLRVRKAEAFLTGQVLDQQTLDQAGKIAVEEASPRTSLRASAEYRKAILPVLVRRAGLEVLAKLT